MNIEQYFGGRIRYIQVGDNGNSQPGVGIYAMSPGISKLDIAELQKRYKRYLGNDMNEDGIRPTIFKRLLLPTGTIALTACSYIPAPKGIDGSVIDRPDWIDHSYLVRAEDAASLDPEKWLGLPYRTDDPNPTWEVMPDEVAECLKTKGVYKSEKWITAESLTDFPKSSFRLYPLSDVLEMWELEDQEMSDLVAAVMDCVAAPDSEGRKLFIKYDINAEDCSGSRFWNHMEMDAEEFNRFRMEHLIAWIYHLIPFSFRRLLSYDSTLDAYAGFHHIIFVPKNRIFTLRSGQIAFMFPSFDGTRLSENQNYMLIGGGYYYDHEKGIWHDSAAGNQGYKEIYQKEGIIQKLIDEEVESYLGAKSIEDAHKIIKEYYAFFEQLEKHIPIYSNSIAELESEIPRWKTALVADPEELKRMAITLLDRRGEEDISINEGNYEYFLHVMSTLESRITEENRDELWIPVLEHIVTRPAFTDQIDYVRKLAGAILNAPDNLERFNRYAEDKTFEEAVVDDTSVITWLFAYLSEDDQFRIDWLSEQYGEGSKYIARLEAYDKVSEQYNTLSKIADTGILHDANRAYYESLPLLIDTENVREILLASSDGKISEDALQLAEGTVRNLTAEYKSLKIYEKVKHEGPGAFRAFNDSISKSIFSEAEILTEHLLDTVYGEWLSKFGEKRISPEELEEAVDLLVENESNKKFDNHARKLMRTIGVVSPGESDNALFRELTVDELGTYLKRIKGTDENAIKALCRLQLYTYAVSAINENAVVPGKDDFKVLSEYLTTEQRDAENNSHSNYLRKKIGEGLNALTIIVTERLKAEGSLKSTAKLIDSLNDDNILNCRQTLNELLPVTREIIDTLCESGKANEAVIEEFGRAFRWWSSEPEVREERRRIVRAADYKPSFKEISETIADASRPAFERLADNGFIYDIGQNGRTRADDVWEVMKREPEHMQTAEWVNYYCYWIKDALSSTDLGKSVTDYLLLDVMCKVVLRYGISDVSPRACVDQKWLESLPTSKLKADKLEKKGVNADSLFTLLGVKDVCEQLSSAKTKKVTLSDSAVNNAVEKMIGNGKVYIRFNEKTLEAVCTYLEEQPNLFRNMLYTWRVDKTIKVIEALRSRLEIGEMTRYKNIFDKEMIGLKRLYTDEELGAVMRAMGMLNKTMHREEADDLERNKSDVQPGNRRNKSGKKKKTDRND